MSDRERQALLDAFDSNWIAPVGPALTEFEARLRSLSETDAAVGVTSGTAALHLALLALDVRPGDVVICPSVTFVASANVIRYVGATPHFVDCDPVTGNMDPESLLHALRHLDTAGHRPAAVITVDLYGTCVDYQTIELICGRYGVPIVEDAAEALGATHRGRPAGSFGVLAAYSFNGNKLVTTGGGGALVGRADLVDRARHLAQQAREPFAHFEHNEVGYAYRMSNLSAAIGLAQLSRLDLMIDRTRAIHRHYVTALGSIPGLTFAPQNIDGNGNAWLTVAHLDQTLHASPHAVCEALGRHNIEARPAWKPMHLQPLYRDVPITGGRGAAKHFETGICLPSGSSMTDTDLDRVVSVIRSALAQDEVINLLDEIDVTEQPQQRQDNPATTN